MAVTRYITHPEVVVDADVAVDVQRRIVDALADLLLDESTGDVAVVGHGGVGTLWYCHLAQLGDPSLAGSEGVEARCWDHLPAGKDIVFRRGGTSDLDRRELR